MNTNQPNQPQTPTTPNPETINSSSFTQTPVQPPPPKKKTPWLLIAIIILLLSVTGVLGYKYYELKQQMDNQQTTPSPSPQLVVSSPSPITSPSTELDPMAGWKTYNNSRFNYSIKYPPEWNIDSSQAENYNQETGQSAELTIYKGKYKLRILWPAAYGPGICLFDDQSRDGAPEMASYCEGEYVEFTNQSQSVHRRLVNPKSNVAETGIVYDEAEWEVYTQESNNKYFVTVPPIRFTAPLQYQQSSIKIMDQILASYQSLN